MKKKSLLYLTFILTLVAFTLPARSALHPEMGNLPKSVVKRVTSFQVSPHEQVALRDKLPLTHQDYMEAAGIAPADYDAVDYIFSHESGWSTYNPNATSGSCGVGQAWPCGKLSCGHTDADLLCQVKWFNSYAQRTYGSWGNAQQFWLDNHWW